MNIVNLRFSKQYGLHYCECSKSDFIENQNPKHRQSDRDAKCKILDHNFAAKFLILSCFSSLFFSLLEGNN